MKIRLLPLVDAPDLMEEVYKIKHYLDGFLYDVEVNKIGGISERFRSADYDDCPFVILVDWTDLDDDTVKIRFKDDTDGMLTIYKWDLCIFLRDYEEGGKDLFKRFEGIRSELNKLSESFIPDLSTDVLEYTHDQAVFQFGRDIGCLEEWLHWVESTNTCADSTNDDHLLMRDDYVCSLLEQVLDRIKNDKKSVYFLGDDG